MYRFFLYFIGVAVFTMWLLWIFLIGPTHKKVVIYNYPKPTQYGMWEFQSIDTMKYSRDLAREKLRDTSFDKVINQQVKNIADIGATHIAIATPYDEEFVPILKRWVSAARANGLHVWFRGNFSGWEGWFDYPRISPEEHNAKTKEFILKHPELFEDGDAFSSCPECENGGPGDPRQTGETEAYRAFLVEDFLTTKEAFKKIGKNVKQDLYSMNGDVARLIMTESFAHQVGNTVTVDHYVKTPEQLARDLSSFSLKGKRPVVLGEFGAPIPDIHGNMTREQQARWIYDALVNIAHSPSVVGVNYWLAVGGSTELWDKDGDAKPAANTLKVFFKPAMVYGFVRDDFGDPLEGVLVRAGDWAVTTDNHGYFLLRFPRSDSGTANFSLPGYETIELPVETDGDMSPIVMRPSHPSFLRNMISFIRSIAGNE